MGERFLVLEEDFSDPWCCRKAPARRRASQCAARRQFLQVRGGEAGLAAVGSSGPGLGVGAGGGGDRDP